MSWTVVIVLDFYFGLLKPLDATCHVRQTRVLTFTHSLGEFRGKKFLQIKFDIDFLNAWNLIYFFHEIPIPLPSYEAGCYIE